jgi:uncharacterized protein YqeY
MQTPRERIEAEIKEALKSGEKERLSTLRLLLNAITNERIRSGQEVDETSFLSLVQKAIKQRRESAQQYRRGKREELAAKEEREADILSAYLPPPASEEELAAAIREFTEQEGLSGPAALGQVMKEMMARFGGRAEGGTINKLAREILSQSSR